MVLFMSAGTPPISHPDITGTRPVEDRSCQLVTVNLPLSCDIFRRRSLPPETLPPLMDW